ncbi:HU family DNA-binding protein [Mesoplasma corruscae]|uniref:30S ribosomal protein S6 n=1 Tax=Mesoplasma corruscae TaxID=216874 RepID=A0A2S5RH69_9MOLU|nr:HU family DNA-binding protein [Mesoplasma corruscae]PPE06684.1 30S ribosomal protein S6 [Mesoplasma corruscae]
MSFVKSNQKHKNSWSLFFQLIVIILIIIVFKVTNQLTLGNQEWLEKINQLIIGTNEKWFNGFNILQSIVGPIGFKSFIQFKSVFGTEVALPVLFDMILNWATVLFLILYIQLIFFSIRRENRFNRIISEKDEDFELIEVKQKVEKPVIVQEVKQEPLVEEKPVKLKTKKQKVEKPVIVQEVKQEDTLIANPRQQKVEKKVFAKPAKIKSEKLTKEANVKPISNSSAKTSFETVQVTKKHYEQVSKADILKKLYEVFPNEKKSYMKNTIEVIFKIIGDKINLREEVIINNFGKFISQHKDARQGINPLTGQQLDIEASNTIKFKAAKHLKDEMTKQTWTGLYFVNKQVEMDKTIVDEKVNDFTIEEKTKSTSKPKVEKNQQSAEELLKKYEKNLKEKKPSQLNSKMSTQERAKLDGSDSIEETRSELQKHANSIRKIATEKNLKKSLSDINLRDMTKKEIIVYMHKVKQELSK